MCVAVAVPIAACSRSSSSKASAPATTSAASTTTSTVPSLTERIRHEWEGVQLEAIGPKPAPEAAVLFFHHGTWAAEAVRKTPTSWCLRAVYTWSIADATTENDFVINYDLVSQPTTCLPLNARHFVLAVSGSHQETGRKVYTGGYTAPLSVSLSRTVCNGHWNATEPCGVSTPGLELPAPPTG